MKFITFRYLGQDAVGLMHDNGVVNITERDPSVRSLKEAIANGRLDDMLNRFGGMAPDLDVAEIEFRPVIPDPGKIICVGLNYETHRRETGREKTEYPAIFTRFADTQVGHLKPIVRPKISDMLDYEGELAVIIGAPLYRSDQNDVMAAVAGYSIYNDASVRDWQRHTIQFTPGKNFVGTGAFGPGLVPRDLAGDIHDKRIETRLNGEVMQSASTSHLIFDIPTILSYVSQFTPLGPGDVIATGTPGGVGFKREPQVFMRPGDEVRVWVQDIGELANHIIDEV